MAEFFKRGEWGGPGEEKTAEFLRLNLPDDWVIVANVSLPTEQREDVDLLVVGKNLVFVVETKFWGPRVLLDNHSWVVESNIGANHPHSKQRKSPMGVLAQKAKKVQGLMAKHLPSALVVKQKPVIHLVVMAHPRLSLRGDCADKALISPLGNSHTRLMDLDGGRSTDLDQVRDEVVELLSGIQPSPAKLTHLGDYKIQEHLGSMGPVTLFGAEHDITFENVILFCYPRSENAQVNNVLDRDRVALARLSGLQRTWRVYPPFADDERGWLVLPQAKPDFARHLGELSVGEALSGEDPQAVRGLVKEVFEALAQVHAEDVVHRALAPEKIWLGRGKRVYFSHFFRARVSDTETLHQVKLGEKDRQFASPEVQEDAHSATKESDVYAAARVLLEFFGRDGSSVLEGEVHAELRKIIDSCLADKMSDRPTASAVVAKIDALDRPEPSVELDEAVSEPPTSNVFSEGALYSGKYRIEAVLGEGGASKAWRAVDTVEQKTVVLRQLKLEAEFERLKGNPPGISLVNHQSCQRHFSLESEPAPGVQVVSFFDGQTLAARHRANPLSVEGFRAIAVGLLGVLHEAFHERDLVHGDISPKNVLVDEDLNVHLIDLTSVVRVGEPPGPHTPAFFAPELRRGGTVSPQSDIYAVSSVILHLMLGRPLYEGDPGSADSGRVVIKPTEDEIAQWGRDGAALLSALFRGIAPDPENRPYRADEYARVVKTAKAPAIEAMPELGAVDNINPSVDAIRELYVDSVLGNAGMLAEESEFAKSTYVANKLDEELVPRVLSGDHSLVLITGNPGDGKTSFLHSLRRVVEERGGSTLASSQAVWSGLLGNLSITTVLDASESFEGKSSDAVLDEAMLAKGGATNHVTVVAINDGRLYQLVEERDEQIPGLRDAFEKSRDSLSSGPVLIVDLKLRSLVTTRDSGLGLQLVDSLVAPELWEDGGCGGCASKGVCPILRNVKLLREEGRPGVQRLLMVSHLSSERRATIRDFRSAMAWSITHDWGCDDVHRARESDDFGLTNVELATWNSVFEATTSDKLLTEWREFDPALAVSPEALRAFVEGSASESQYLLDSNELASHVRRNFMVQAFRDESEASALGHYRYLPYFLRVVMDGKDLDAFRLRLLTGLSSLSGIHLGLGEGLAVTTDTIDPAWRLIRTLNADDFSVERQNFGETWMEYLSDAVSLRHKDLQVDLKVSLDMAELLLRAADGEIFDDLDSAPLRAQAMNFVNRLAKSKGEQAHILSPSSKRVGLALEQGRIRMEDPS